MEPDRVVEVLHDCGESVAPRWLLGSGFVVKSGVVITAAHNLGESDQAGPTPTVVRTLGGAEYLAFVLARTDVLDLALLGVAGLKADHVKIGQLDRERIDVVRNVVTAGFPNYKFAAERPAASQRQPAQPFGSIPTVEDLPTGKMTLKIDAGEPESGEDWAGLSGSGVFVSDHLIGVVIEHNPAEGNGSLRLVPIQQLGDLPPGDMVPFCAILGFDDPNGLPVVNPLAVREIDSKTQALINELRTLDGLQELGLLGPGEVSPLKIKAVMVNRGWQ